MRIRDWSSDVCSSDLRFLRTRTEVAIAMPQFFLRQEMRERRQHDDGANHVDEESEYQQHAHVALELQPREDPQCDTDRQTDAGEQRRFARARHSVVWGTSV